MEASEVKFARAQLEMYAQSEAEVKREVGQSLSIQKIPTERCVPQLSAERERLACTVAERDALKVLCLYPWLPHDAPDRVHSLPSGSVSAACRHSSRMRGVTRCAA